MDKEMEAAVKRFTKNPYWKKYYEEAPSDACKQYIALQFQNSASVADGEGTLNLKDEFKKCEDQFTLEDWKHMEKYAGNTPFRSKCRSKIKELE